MKTLKDLLRQKNFMFKLGILIFIAWIAIALLAPVISPYDPVTDQDVAMSYQSPSGQHWFGTDELGRDVFSRVLYGSRVSISCGLITVLISFVVGIIFGGLAGYTGGLVDDIMMRFSEMIQSFPPLILAMVIAAALGTQYLQFRAGHGYHLVAQLRAPHPQHRHLHQAERLYHRQPGAGGYSYPDSGQGVAAQQRGVSDCHVHLRFGQ